MAAGCCCIGVPRSDCAVLSDGRVVFSPFMSQSVLILDPASQQTTLFGNFAGHLNWFPRWHVPIGRLIMARSGVRGALCGKVGVVSFSCGYSLQNSFCCAFASASTLVVFELDAVRSGCTVLSDDRVVFAPFAARSVLILNPVSDEFALVGNFDGSSKWCAGLEGSH